MSRLLNPQLFIPPERRIYCQECKILLADKEIEILDNVKEYYCDECYNKKFKR